MNCARTWTVMRAVAVVGVLLASCSGETAKQDATPQPVAVAPRSDTVVHTAIFSSPFGREWVKSQTGWQELHFADPGLAWANVVGKTYTVIEAGCMNENGDPEHCHLEVNKDVSGQSVPVRTFSVTNGSGNKKYNIELLTPGNQKEFMICKDVEEDASNDEFVSGSCDVYPKHKPPSPPDPKHNFCAHTRKEFGKLAIYYRFSHKDCTLNSLNVHNGNGHTN